MIRGLINVYKIWKWHKETFPEYTGVGQKLKIRGEINEFIKDFNTYTTKRGKSATRYSEKAEGELIDVIISSINAMRFPEVREEVNRKMAENYKRSWINGQHKR